MTMNMNDIERALRELRLSGVRATLDTRVLQALHQCVGQGWAAQASITPDGHRGLALGPCHRTESTTQLTRDFLVDGARHNAANVIGFENAG